MSLAQLPKVELHLHLEGAAPPEFIRRLADEKHIDLSGIFDERGAYRYNGFTDFLRVYEAATSVLRTPQDFARLTAEVLERSLDQGVVYTEFFLSPDFCGGRDLAAWREYLHAIEEAAAAMEPRGITMRGIVTAIRHFGPDKAKETALCAAETAGRFICGFGMGGDEGAGRPADFAWSFDMAREAQLGITAHAGDWAGPRAIVETLDTLRPTRIGHGVRAIEDPALVDRLAEDGIVLEFCPGSNIALGIYRDWVSHPIARFLDRGVKVTVSSDDPPFFHTDMSREYDRLADAFGWDEGVFRDINTVALDAAFCDGTTRRRVAERLRQP